MGWFKQTTTRLDDLEKDNRLLRKELTDAITRVYDLEGAFTAIARMHIKDYVKSMDPFCASYTRYRHYLVDLEEEKPKPKKAINHKPRLRGTEKLR